MFPNQETVAWQGNFAFQLARTMEPKYKDGFDRTFSKKDGGVFNWKPEYFGFTCRKDFPPSRKV